MMVETRNFDAAEYLDSPEAIAAYLEDALDDNPSEFLEALGVVARAKGMTELAGQAGLSREFLYGSLTSSGRPDFQTILHVLKAIGVELRLTVAEVASTETLRQSDIGAT